ncbi:MAG TPA: DUF3455 domain-containing protein [Edaphobacter sp.]|jgi:hypothetical protein
MLTALILLALFAPQKTDPTLPPTSARVAYTVEGRGVQIYRCTRQDSAFTWVFQAPEATLFDSSTHQQTGTHSAGPIWTWKDSSAITGKVLEKSPSPDPLSIPWLLLTTTPSGATTGALSTITLVRRSNTHGGNAPSTGCDARHDGNTFRARYTATYTFYTSP